MAGGAQHVQDSGLALNQIIDTSVANTTYVCEAAPGTASSAAGWRIRRIVVVNSVTSISWAGTGNFDQIADNRLALAYA